MSARSMPIHTELDESRQALLRQLNLAAQSGRTKVELIEDAQSTFTAMMQIIELWHE